MLTEICADLRNWFVTPNGVHHGTYTIAGGSIAPLDFLQDGQYYRIVGSVFNDGVYRYPDDILYDETFCGEVWAMAVPPAVIALADEIKEYNESSGKSSAYVSETFGGYTYTKATGSDGTPLAWRTAYATRLSKYRRI